MSDRRSNRQIILWIVAGLSVWGVYLAIGDYVQNKNLLRSLVIIACVALFLGMWLLALNVGRGGRSR